MVSAATLFLVDFPLRIRPVFETTPNLSWFKSVPAAFQTIPSFVTGGIFKYQPNLSKNCKFLILFFICKLVLLLYLLV
jgi:hypothetical protein